MAGQRTTTWFIAEAQRQGLIGQLVLDTHDHPSVISAGGVMIHDGHVLTEISSGAWDLPKGKIEFDETPESAATRVLQIATGTRFPQSLVDISSTSTTGLKTQSCIIEPDTLLPHVHRRNVSR